MKPSEVTPTILAYVMRLHVTELWDLRHDTVSLYKKQREILVGKKKRVIDPPTFRGKQLLRMLHRFIQRHLPPHRCVHGGAKGKSCFSAADLHCGRQFVITRDITDCYPSITPDGLFKRLKDLGFTVEVSTILTALFTVHGRVPQGAPTSSDALNFFLFDSDRQLSAICGAWGASYSRTYDDMVISTNNTRNVGKLQTLLESAIEDHNLSVNARKKAKNGLVPNNRIQLVHNIQVNNRHGVRIPAEQSKQAVGLAERFVAGARCVNADSLESIAYMRSRVDGWMHHCRQADFGPAAHIRLLIERGDRLVLNRLKRIGLSAVPKSWWMVAGRRNEPARLACQWKRLASSTVRKAG